MTALRQALIEAAGGNKEAVQAFLAQLLKSEVYVPLQSVPIVNPSDESSPITAVATDKFVFVNHHGRRVLPIFTSEQLVAEWTEQEQPVIAKPFHALLWLIQKEQWLHLDPGSDIGKEFSPWEIALLRQGEEALEEIVADLLEDNQEVLGVEEIPPEYAALKKQLRTTVEVYAEIEEAFLIAGKEEETREPFPIVLLKQNDISFEKRAQLAMEIENAAEAILGRKMVSIIDDIGREDSPNRKLLVGFTPFYIAQQPLGKKAEPTFFERLKARIFQGA